MLLPVPLLRPPALILAGIGGLAAVLPWQQTPAAEPLAALPLRQIGEVKAMTDLADRSLPVDLEGVVTYATGAGNFFLHDGDIGIHVGQSEAGRQLQPGDRVRVFGVTREGGYAPSVEPSAIVALGRGVLPEPRRAGFNEIAAGNLDGQWLEVTGVVWEVAAGPGAGAPVLTLAVDGRRLRATVNHPAVAELESLIDAGVRVRGVATGSFNPQRQLVEPLLRVPGRSDVTVLRPAPADPFGAPEVPLARLLGYSLDAPSPHRVRIRGVVTRRLAERVLFLRAGHLGLRVETRGPAGGHPGDAIEVVGFPAMVRGTAVLTGAVARVVGRGPAPPPLVAAWSALWSSAHQADLVTVRARLVDWVAAGETATLLLQAEDQLFRATLPGASAAAALPPRNSVLDATGIWTSGEAEAPGESRAFTLLLSAPTDLVVRERPGWWTPERLWRALAAALVLLALGVGWVWSLRRQVRRTRRVIAQQARHAAVLEERSRIARDLHDTLEQGLTGLSLQLKVVEMDHREAPHQVGEGLEVARQLLRRSRALAHDAIRELRTDDVARRHEPLVAALHRLAAGWQHTGVPGVTLDIAGRVRSLPAATERNLTGIAAAAITNAVKHGRATAITVRLRFAPDGVTLRIEDNGAGLDVNRSAGNGEGGFGLVGMRERVAAMGGRLEVCGRPGAGTSVVVAVPAAESVPAGSQLETSPGAAASRPANVENPGGS